MKNIALLFLVSIVSMGCATDILAPYEKLIVSDFKASEHYKGKGKVDCQLRSVYETKQQFLKENQTTVEDGELESYEIVDYQVLYDGAYWLESYQVFRLCDKSECKHKFVLIVGVYA